MRYRLALQHSPAVRLGACMQLLPVPTHRGRFGLHRRALQALEMGKWLRSAWLQRSAMRGCSTIPLATQLLQGGPGGQGDMRLRCRPAPCLAPLRDRPLCCWARCRRLLRAAVDGVAEGSSCGLHHVATCRIGAMRPLAALLHNRSTTAGSTSGCMAGRTPSVPPPARRCPQTAGRAASQTRPRSSWLTAAGRGVAEGRRRTWCKSGAWT